MNNNFITVLAVLRTLAWITSWVFLAWAIIEILYHIDEHGLKHLLELLWYGPNYGG